MIAPNVLKVISLAGAVGLLVACDAVQEVPRHEQAYSCQKQSSSSASPFVDSGCMDNASGLLATLDARIGSLEQTMRSMQAGQVPTGKLSVVDTHSALARESHAIGSNVSSGSSSRHDMESDASVNDTSIAASPDVRASLLDMQFESEVPARGDADANLAEFQTLLGGLEGQEVHITGGECRETMCRFEVGHSGDVFPNQIVQSLVSESDAWAGPSYFESVYDSTTQSHRTRVYVSRDPATN